MTTQDEEQYRALAVWGIRQDRARGPWGSEDVAYVQYSTIIQRVSKTDYSCLTFLCVCVCFVAGNK